MNVKLPEICALGEKKMLGQVKQREPYSISARSIRSVGLLPSSGPNGDYLRRK